MKSRGPKDHMVYATYIYIYTAMAHVVCYMFFSKGFWKIRARRAVAGIATGGSLGPVQRSKGVSIGALVISPSFFQSQQENFELFGFLIWPL